MNYLAATFLLLALGALVAFVGFWTNFCLNISNGATWGLVLCLSPLLLAAFFLLAWATS